MSFLDTLFSDTDKFTCISIPNSHVDNIKDMSEFELNESYFQIVVSQIYVKNINVILREYLPILYAKFNFQLGSTRETVSCVLDPRSERYINNASSGMSNQLLIGPIPLTDYKVSLSLGLFKIKISDYLPAVIKLLTNLTLTIAPQLTIASKISASITEGFNDLLSGKQSLVVGINDSFDQFKVIKPGYLLLVKKDVVNKNELWISDDGKLYYGEDRDLSIPYDESDFVVIRIDRVDKRTDYREIYPISRLYAEAMSHLTKGDRASLTQSYQELIRVISGIVEFTPNDAKRISILLGKEFSKR